MYGTIARYRVKQGHEEAVSRQFDDLTASPPKGWIASTVYRSVGDPNEVWISTVFESEALYKQNADSPEMNTRYRTLVEHLEGQPEWHDGHVVRHQAKAEAAV